MYKFEFSDKELDEISKKALLSPLQKEIIEYRIKDYSLVKIAELTKNSTSTVSRQIVKIVKKIKRIIW